MSETQPIAPAQGRIPTIYFIDDSATMREVIKIAFRKESIHIIACADATSALAQFASAAPDAVITDVIMPDKDGYQVCEFVKQHAQFSQTPVVLMSGIVNRDVAEKAMSVKADDLIRKPFQPQDLVARVKTMLAAKFPNVASGAPSSGHGFTRADKAAGNAPLAAEGSDSSNSGFPLATSSPLANFFNPSLAANSPNPAARLDAPSVPPSAWADRAAPSGALPGLASAGRPASPPQSAADRAFSTPRSGSSLPQSPASLAPSSSSVGVSDRPASTTRHAQPRASSQASPTPAQQSAAPSSAELQRLRSEVLRLELLVKKLQAELEAEHQYCASLESHFKSLQE